MIKGLVYQFVCPKPEFVIFGYPFFATWARKHKYICCILYYLDSLHDADQIFRFYWPIIGYKREVSLNV